MAVGMSVTLGKYEDYVGAWPELVDALGAGRVVHLANGAIIDVGALERGTTGGKPSIALKIDLPDGRVVVAETTLALFLTTADALQAKFGDPRE